MLTLWGIPTEKKYKIKIKPKSITLKQDTKLRQSFNNVYINKYIEMEWVNLILECIQRQFYSK